MHLISNKCYLNLRTQCWPVADRPLPSLTQGRMLTKPPTVLFRFLPLPQDACWHVADRPLPSITQGRMLTLPPTVLIFTYTLGGAKDACWPVADRPLSSLTQGRLLTKPPTALSTPSESMAACYPPRPLHCTAISTYSSPEYQQLHIDHYPGLS